MTWWFLISLLLTTDGHPAADIPIPFGTEAECNAAGLQRSAEIKSSDNLSHGIWACEAVNFEVLDPVPASLPPEPLEPKREG